MADAPLNRELISDPALWRLSLELSADRIDVVIYSTLEDNSLIYRRIPIDQTKPYIEALREAVYDNPLLLSDFGRTDVLIDTPRFTLVPLTAELTDDTAAELMSVLWPTDDYQTLVSELASSGMALLAAADKDVLAFMRRTFVEARISHRLVPTLKYHYNKGRLGNTSRMYVHLMPGRTDIIYIHDGRLTVVNTVDTPSVSDTLYYLMAAVKGAGYDVHRDQMMLYGTPSLREELAPLLRKYVANVLPGVFPSTLHSGDQVMQQAPFELVVIPICE